MSQGVIGNWLGDDFDPQNNVPWNDVSDGNGGFLDVNNVLIPEPRLRFKRLPLNQRRAEARQAVQNFTSFFEGDFSVTRAAEVASMVTKLAALDTPGPNIGFDMEASELGFESPPGTIQIRDYQNEVSYLVDLFVLELTAWDTPGADGSTTLRTIFEDPNRHKLVFDGRNDSLCLFGQLGIKVRGVLDVQIMHMLTMNGPPDRRGKLEDTVRDLVTMTPEQFATFSREKKHPDEVAQWEYRPLSLEAWRYALGDVKHLHSVYAAAAAKLSAEGMEQAFIQTDVEVQLTHTLGADYQAQHTKARTTQRFRDTWAKVPALLKPGATPCQALMIAPPRPGEDDGYP